jgi:hypothetical protein
LAIGPDPENPCLEPFLQREMHRSLRVKHLDRRPPPPPIRGRPAVVAAKLQTARQPYHCGTQFGQTTIVLLIPARVLDHPCASD